MRKVGKKNEMKMSFSDYSYIVNGVGGIGKTTLAHELGLHIAGNEEGSFIISIGEEPSPEHIDGAFGDLAPTWKELKFIVDELVNNKSDYPDTKFVVLDSADELFRIAENEILRQFNAEQTDANKRVKTIKACYGGFQAGENRVVDMVVGTIFKLRKAGYSLVIIGHTKIKSKVDPMTEIAYEQLTCNLDGKYFNAIKDKVNLVATCYIERTLDDVKEKKDAFSKEMKKVGKLTEEKRVICFRDDNMTVDTKSHFKNIEPKIEFGTQNFIDAVEEAIKLDLEEKRGVKITDEQVEEMQSKQQETKQIIPTVQEDAQIEIDPEIEEFGVDELKNKELMKIIVPKFRTATEEQKGQIKEILAMYDEEKLNAKCQTKALKEIASIL